MGRSSNQFATEVREARAAAAAEASWTDAGVEIQSQWSSWSSAYPQPSQAAADAASTEVAASQDND